MDQMWPWVLTAGSALGLWIAGNHTKWGWLIAFANQFVWLYFAIHTEQWGFCAHAGVFGWVYARNLLRWHHAPPVSAGSIEATNSPAVVRHRTSMLSPWSQAAMNPSGLPPRQYL